MHTVVALGTGRADVEVQSAAVVCGCAVRAGTAEAAGDTAARAVVVAGAAVVALCHISSHQSAVTVRETPSMEHAGSDDDLVVKAEGEGRCSASSYYCHDRLLVVAEVACRQATALVTVHGGLGMPSLKAEAALVVASVLEGLQLVPVPVSGPALEAWPRREALL